MFTHFDKALTAGIVGLISAVVLQMTGAGAGPTPDQVANVATQSGTLVSSLVIAAINAALVYIVPNKA
jgi:hypothetical protein